MAVKRIRLPLSHDDVRGLRIGEVVSASGPLVTGRDAVQMRALDYHDRGKVVPKELEGATLFHCGPIMARGPNGWTVVAAGPTTSARMDKAGPEMIRTFSVRAVIGKGGMSQDVLEAMREVGCVYLAATGGTAVSLAESLPRVRGVEWEDLGMAEAMWLLEAENLGPLVVAMDAHGNSLYEDVRRSLKRS
ncbi:MAG: fumarate hydratase [Euryarchaeota archaeon]|jgi:fumarate hydratase subunit beta|nr:fumarate hydratase [Euryarchaeota archaeon]